jgi:hypothetical protein
MGGGIILGGVVAVEEVFGLAAMWIAVAGVYLLHIWLLNRTETATPATPKKCSS